MAKKTTTKSPRRSAGPATTGKSRLPGLRVRMYRHGLGDCFLLTFDPDGPDPRHMLIDCGTLGKKATSVKMKDVLDDIRKTTGGHLHHVVATHEHQDHVSGFAPETFTGFTVDEPWLAWTEKPGDEVAKTLKTLEKNVGAALVAAANAPAAGASGGATMTEAIRSLLGLSDLPEELAAGKFAQSVDECMDHVRVGLGSEAKYLRPGDQPIETIPGFRIYVLGPPRSGDWLTKADDASGLYGLVAGLRASAADGASLSIQEQDDCELYMPFDQRLRADEAQAKKWYASYFAEENKSRRADADWLQAASNLALQLVDGLNNTSLAMAIERIADGKVLLFPGDAQQGNWLSWHEPKLTWTVKESDGRTRVVTIDDLLSRTVLYKVGHHASHNATPRQKGLEMMDCEKDLIAMIPVDRAVALQRSPKGSWRMPARALYQRLLERCQGRVVRSDIGWAVDGADAENKATESEFVGLVGRDVWKKYAASQKAAETAKRVEIGEVYIDFNLGS